VKLPRDREIKREDVGEPWVSPESPCSEGWSLDRVGEI